MNLHKQISTGKAHQGSTIQVSSKKLCFWCQWWIFPLYFDCLKIEYWKQNGKDVSSQGVLNNSVVVVQSKNILYYQIRNWWSIQMHKNPLMIKANSIQFDFFFPKWASTLNFRLKYLIWQGDSSIKMSFVHELYFFLFFMTFMFAKYKWPRMY